MGRFKYSVIWLNKSWSLGIVIRILKSFHTFARTFDPNNKGYRSFFQLKSMILIYKNGKVRQGSIAFIIRAGTSQKELESSKNYRIHYLKHCYWSWRIWTQSIMCLDLSEVELCTKENRDLKKIFFSATFRLNIDLWTLSP